MAILQAVSFIKDNFTGGQFLIITDSLSALDSIASNLTQDKLSVAPAIISLIKSAPHILDFLWVPAHSGIAGNEMADHIAKAARTSLSKIKLLPVSELFSLIQRSTQDDWAIQYKNSFNNPHSHYIKIQSSIPQQPWYKMFPSILRSLIIKLSRLRFGHNRLPLHLKRLNISDFDLCPLHPDTPEIADLNHLFFECKSLTLQQQHLYSKVLKLHIPTPTIATDLLSLDNISIFPHLVDFIANLPTEINI